MIEYIGRHRALDESRCNEPLPPAFDKRGTARCERLKGHPETDLSPTVHARYNPVRNYVQTWGSA